MNTGETLRMIGSVTNRTDTPWVEDQIALQVDRDGNRQFIGQAETQFGAKPKQACSTCDAVYDYNFTWEPKEYPAKTYGMRVDFSNSAYYFTGNTSTLSPTGAYINVSVIGTVSLYDQLGDYETIDGYRLVVQSEMVSIDENNNFAKERISRLLASKLFRKILLNINSSEN